MAAKLDTVQLDDVDHFRADQGQQWLTDEGHFKVRLGGWRWSCLVSPGFTLAELFGLSLIGSQHYGQLRSKRARRVVVGQL